MSSRASRKQRWGLKQGLNHAKSRIRDAWTRRVPKQGLNYAKSLIREAAAAAQAHAESPPATFLLRASFAASKAGVGAQARTKSC